MIKNAKKYITILLISVLIFFIIYELLCWFAMPVSDHPFCNQDKFLVIAHRGGRSLGPEHTLYTYRKAVKIGVDVLEMDIRITRDMQLVILHDNNVATTTNATGLVENYSFDELKRLDAAYHWSLDNGKTFPLRNKGIKVPSLIEVFSEFPETRMNLEIKDFRLNVVNYLCQAIRDHQMTNKVMVASFDSDSLKHFRLICPQVATSAGSSEGVFFWGIQKVHLEAAYSPDFQALQVPSTYNKLLFVDRRLASEYN